MTRPSPLRSRLVLIMLVLGLGRSGFAQEDEPAAPPSIPVEIPGTVLFRVPWGTGPGQIGYYNAATDPEFSQPDAEGPGGLCRAPNGDIWISDRFNDRLLRFASDGTLLETRETVGGIRVRKPGAIWVGAEHAAVSDREAGGLVLFHPSNPEVAAGHVLVPSETTPFRQIEALVGTPEALHLGDFAMSQIMDLSHDGEILGLRRWDLTGLGIDPAGALATFEVREEGRHALIHREESGVWSEDFTLPSATLGHPTLIGIDRSGRTYVRTHENTDYIRIYEIAVGGEPRHFLGELPLLPLQQQFTVNPDGGILGLVFDAEAAPEGDVAILRLP